MAAPQITPRTDLRSPNFDDVQIPVEYVLIHYTAGDLDRALSHFLTTERQVSCHLLIAADGRVFELVDCWLGTAKKAAHAGASRLATDKGALQGFNAFSIGIELENLNGNLLPFSDAQYDALVQCLKHLASVYPALRDPNRILGHEDVARWRGKADPGRMFDWLRVFRSAYPGQPAPSRVPACPDLLAEALSKFLSVVPASRDESVKFWHALSATTEAAVSLRHESQLLGKPER